MKDATTVEAEEAYDIEDRSPPRYLCQRSRAWLRHLASTYQFSPSEWNLAVLAAEAWDRAQTARRQLGREGLTVRTPALNKRGEVVGERIAAHPLVAVAKEAAAAHASLVHQLQLDVSNLKES